MQTLVLVGAGQGLVSIIHLPVVLNHVTNLDLNGLILYDLANVGALISEHVRTLALVDCSIVVRITTALPLEDLEIHYMHYTIQGLNRYELSLRWSHVFSTVAASRIRHFSFGSTQLIDGCKVFIRKRHQPRQSRPVQGILFQQAVSMSLRPCDLRD